MNFLYVKVYFPALHADTSVNKRNMKVGRKEGRKSGIEKLSFNCVDFSFTKAFGFYNYFFL